MKPFLKVKCGHFDALCEHIDVTKRVYVYKNLHKNCYSVKQGGIVCVHTDGVTLKDVKFIVSQIGRNKVLKEKRKNVHAYVTGYMINPNEAMRAYLDTDGGTWESIYYDPYKYSNFVHEKKPVYSAQWCDMLFIDNSDIIAFGAK